MSTNYTHWFIRARLKTRQLLLLVAMEEEGNIHGAAQVLNMTQPAASKLLKDLDEFPTPDERPDYYVDFDETGPFSGEVGVGECAGT